MNGPSKKMYCNLLQRNSVLFFGTTIMLTLFYRLINEDMQRRIESLKVENANEEEANSKIVKVEEECVSQI